MRSSKSFLRWEGPVYLELVIGAAEVELASLRFAIDSSIDARDFLTRKSSLNCYSSSRETANFLLRMFDIALLLAL
jgi:hypothetical protein